MDSARFRFDRFLFDPADRRLRRDGVPVEINARYLDALALLVGEAGTLVSKQRFLDEVWRGVPVTDEALTQCIATLRRQLGDDAARPRFIETVPKHGYRFIAPVEGSAPSTARSTAQRHSARRVVLLGAAGTIGGGFAGLVGGIVYGFAGAAQPLAPGMGAASVLIVLVCLTIVAALIGGSGVSFGIAAAGFARSNSWRWSVAGGAAGGMIVGAFAELLGLDAFHLLLGRAPGDISGAVEGLALGAAVGLAAWLARNADDTETQRRAILGAAAIGTAAGAAITGLGGRLMAGSLEQLATGFPDSRLRLDRIGLLLGETGFGPVSAFVTGALEGALFASGIVAAILIARRGLDREP